MKKNYKVISAFHFTCALYPWDATGPQKRQLADAQAHQQHTLTGLPPPSSCGSLASRTTEKIVKHGKIQDSGIHIYLRIVKFLFDSYSLTESQREDGTYAEWPAATVLVP